MTSQSREHYLILRIHVGEPLTVSVTVAGSTDDTFQVWHLPLLSFQHSVHLKPCILWPCAHAPSTSELFTLAGAHPCPQHLFVPGQILQHFPATFSG